MNFQNLTIRTRIIGMILVAVLLGIFAFSIDYFFTSKKENAKALELKAKSILVAGVAAMKNAAHVQKNREVTLSQLRDITVQLQNTNTENERKRLALASEYYKILPIQTGLAIGHDAAQADGITFSYRQINAREAKQELKGFAKTSLMQTRQTKEPFSFSIDWESKTMQAFYAIKVQKEFLHHHGRLQDDIDGNGYDDLGFKMEGWQVDEYHGGYLLTKDISQEYSLALNKFLKVVVIVFVLGLIFSYLLGLIIAKMIEKSLKEPVEMALAISKGDLTYHINAEVENETKPLRVALEQMSTNLRQIIQSISHSSSEQTEASNSLLSGSKRSYENLIEQQSNSEHVVSSMQEMSNSAHNISENINQTAKAASDANKQVESGGKEVAQTIDAIHHLKEDIGQSATHLEEVEKNVADIGNILEVIKGITEQTNLLALNAAIEAARAGEHGRGFAVVADEVRKLAENTHKQTTEIEIMISQLKSSVNSASESMHQGQDTTLSVVKQAECAGESLEKIKNMMEEINTMTLEISSAAQEQSATTTNINDNMVHINELSQQNQSGAQNVNRLGEVLASLSSELQSIVNKFKLS